ncbi:TonB-dependent receptor [Dasania marina]|uniref:TonB-dependent receptor n=1 Tax=Dasania marina TaxID=471499 RepID=UPI0030D8C0E9|tara:strand:- start:58587 stop:60881 length:2295 start_codon:yes stop_codon:yes gene_type:complete
MNKQFRKKLICALVPVSLIASANTYANILEEIIVTAQKKDETIQDVSVSVTAFSGTALKELNMTNSIDIAAQTPGLNIGTPVGEGNNPSISLRGVGLNDFNDNNEGPIAIYRDNIYQAAMPGLTFQLFDLQRVEVLRGPQGTLYGRNATGGLVHFISNAPTEEFSGYADVTLAEYNQVKLEGALSGPITDSISARLSVATNDHDGYVKNRIGPDANEANSEAYRLQVKFQINDELSALVNVHGGKTKTLAPQYQHEATDDGTGTAGVTDLYGYSDTDGDPWAGDYNRKGILDIDSRGASLTVDWYGEDYEFASITAIEDVEKFHQEDTDMGPYSGIEPNFGSENEQFSQEFRLNSSQDGYEWLVGAFYFENEVDGDLSLGVSHFGPVVDGITGAPAGTFGTDLVKFFDYKINYLQKTESAGLFGQLDYDLNDEWLVTVGLRYTQEERSMDYQNRTDGDPSAVLNSCLIPAGDVCGFGFGSSFPGTNTFMDFTDSNPVVAAGDLNELDVDNVSGKIGLDYRPSHDLLVFFNIAQGFKSGGFNGGFLDFTDGVSELDIPFDEELLTSYEVGFKSTMADGDLRLNGTAFYYDYKNYQALTFAGLSQFINNSDATVKGLELEMVWMPSESWDISLGMSALDTEVDEVIVRGVGSVTGSEMVQAPGFTANGLVRYQATDQLSLQVDFSHQADQYFDLSNSDLAKEDSYTVFNARVGYEVNENLTLSAFVKNLTNEEYRVYTFDFTGPAGFNQQFFAPPRWAGVTASYNF